jgi:TBC1 domain-containing protein 4
VLYIGKIKVSHKKVPDSFIDDALEKFRVHELEKGKSKIVKQGSSHNISAGGASSGSSHNISAAGASSGSSQNISTGASSSENSQNLPATNTSTDSSEHPSQAHVPASGVVIGLCRDEEHCHAGSQVSPVLYIVQNRVYQILYNIFQ